MDSKLRFLFSHALFISFCAVGLCTQTYVLLGLQINVLVLSFVFFATICSYNFYWILTNLYFSGSVSILPFVKANKSHFLLLFLSGILVVILSVLLKKYWLVIVLSSLFTLLYSLPMWPQAFAKVLRRAGVVKTLLLAFTWTFVTVVIPAAVDGGKTALTFFLLFFVRFLFMFLLCIIFDARDVADDQKRDMHTVATDIKKKDVGLLFKTVYVAFVISLLAFTIELRLPIQGAAFMFTAGILYLVYLRSKHRQNYFFYYFIVDGLMLVSSIISIIVTFF